ncbi:MAG: hypothetical protein KGZ43_10675 [Sulfuritalea sp.]|nr:hypothetical protein [Sulfuritalea sp.]
MSQLLFHLPPFAADYSGVASVLHDLGGLVVIHDASGCTGSYTGYDEPRWFTSRSSVYCSGLREEDAILGNDEKLLDNIKRVVAEREFFFVAVVGSPVPMLVGFDFAGFANLIEAETGLPAIGFTTSGMPYYHVGMATAFKVLAERFVIDQRPPTPEGVNILGASPLDDFDAATLDAMIECLASVDIKPVSIWGQRSGLDAINRAAGASVNWVVSSAALPLARHMQERWGIPYVVGLPASPAATEQLLAALRRSANGIITTGSASARPTTSTNGSNVDICLLGEQLRMNSLRIALRCERPDAAVNVASFFSWDDGLAESGDSGLDGEEHAAEYLASLSPAVVVGDPLLRSLLPSHLQSRFIDEPHRAISGRLFRHSLVHRFHAEGARFASELLEAADAAR